MWSDQLAALLRTGYNEARAEAGNSVRRLGDDPTETAWSHDNRGDEKWSNSGSVLSVKLTEYAMDYWCEKKSIFRNDPKIVAWATGSMELPLTDMEMTVGRVSWEGREACGMRSRLLRGGDVEWALNTQVWGQKRGLGCRHKFVNQNMNGPESHNMTWMRSPMEGLWTKRRNSRNEP